MLRAPMISTLLISFGLVAQSPVPTGPVRLSLQDAIRTSIEKNLQVQVAVETRESLQAAVLSERGAFDWTLDSGLSLGRTKRASLQTSNSDLIPGATVTRDTENTSTSRNIYASISKPFEWGGTLSVNYGNQGGSLYSSSISQGTSVVTLADGTVQPAIPFGPTAGSPYRYGTNLGATYKQSLLRNFGKDVTGARLIIARKNAEAANFGYQKSIIDLVASTETLYWDVVFAQRNLANKQQALTLAQKQLKENRIRVEVGTLAPIEVTSAEAAEAQRQQDIITAEAQFANAKDALLRSLYPTTARPESLELTDSPTLSHITTDEKSAEKMALERRVELKSARLDYQAKQIQEGASKNRLMPQLDAYVTYQGNSNTRETWSAVNSDLTGAKYPGYSAGLTFSLPIFNHAAKGSMAQARASRRSSELTLRDLELGIALEVRTAIRNVDSTEKGVKAAEKTRIFRAKDLEAEQKKYENGMSTNFLVLSKQDVLDSAKSTELQSQINYAKAVTALEKALGNLLEARKIEL